MSKNVKTKKQRETYLVILVISAMIVAITVILSRIGSINIGNTLRIGFGRVPVFLAGLWFGPVVGLAVGAVADILGALMFTGWNPVITIPAALAGLLPPIVAKVIRLKPQNDSSGRVALFVKVLFTVTLVHLLTSGVLMSVILNYFYPSQSQGLVALMLTRSGIAAAEAVASSIIIYIIYTNSYLNSIIQKYNRK